MQVQAEYIAMIEKFSAEKLALEDLLAERDAAYVGLLQVRLLLLCVCSCNGESKCQKHECSVFIRVWGHVGLSA